MMDGMGYSFAPTREQSEMGERRGGLEGVPQAIKVLSLQMPRFLGARRGAIAPGQLLDAKGAQGEDPYLSALSQSLVKMLTGMQQAGGPGMGQPPPPPRIIPGVDTGEPGSGMTQPPGGYREEERAPMMPSPRMPPVYPGSEGPSGGRAEQLGMSGFQMPGRRRMF